MIQTKIKEITTTLDGITLSYGIRVLSGNTRQTLYKDTGEYKDDRTNGFPCVLMPFVSVKDNEGVMNGEQPIISTEWYEGDVKDSSKAINSNTDGYAISASGTPKYSLSVMKNVPFDESMQITCVFQFQDKRKIGNVTCEASVLFTTNIYSDFDYSVKIDQPNNFSVNPLDYESNEQKWLETINAQLYNGTDIVDDVNAYYQWEVLDNDEWRLFTQDEKDVFVSINGKTLVVDARFFRELSVRVKACYFNGEAPTTIIADNIVTNCTINVAMPYTLTTEIFQTKGIKVDTSLSTEVGYKCSVHYNKKEITDRDNFFRVKWFIKSSKMGSTEIAIGEGMEINFVPNKYNIDVKYSVLVYAKIYMYMVTAIVTNGTKYLTSADGKLLTTKIFE